MAAPLQTTSSKKTAKASKKDASAGVRFNRDERLNLYAAAQYLSVDVREKCGLLIPFEVYLKDPLLARTQPKGGVDKKFQVNWEPGLADGPTSARFAVVDYNGDTGHLAPPAEWDEKQQKFVHDGKVIDGESKEKLQFHQVSVWALLQRALAFFEEGNGLGRRIPWGFEGNRLMVVPHAGYGENAFYDRESKSLQFYYFGPENDTVYTCLSTDIVCHEFGHAVLDGVRPYYNETVAVQTAAFHEAVGDITAILMSLRNNSFRDFLEESTRGDLSKENELAFIAGQFGQAVEGRPYLRSGLNTHTMSDMAAVSSQHRVSEVLTGAVFDILIALTKQYFAPGGDGGTPVDAQPKKKERTVPQVLWDTAARMQRMALQPLDLLPPVEGTFRDYAMAMIRTEELANPLDPRNYRDLMIQVFLKRGIFTAEDEAELSQRKYLSERLDLNVPHPIGDISRSRAAAYRFLDDNRDALFIPAVQDVVIADLYDAHKSGREGARLPRQVVLEYVWREDVLLSGPRFGRYDGQSTSMLCGGTLVLNDSGNVLSWARKAGTHINTNKRGGATERWMKEAEAGKVRLAEFLDAVAMQIAAGRVGALSGSDKGLVGTRVPPVTAKEDTGTVQFLLSPHLHLSEEHHIEEDLGERQWEISC